MTWISRAWSWLRSRLALVAAAASVVLLILWRLAMGQRDAARRERDDAAGRERAAAAKAKRLEQLRADETKARAKHAADKAKLDARQKVLDDARRAVERKLAESRARLDAAQDDEALAAEVERRQREGRLP